MSKRTGVIALAASAVLAAGLMANTAQADTPPGPGVPPTATTPAPAAPDATPPANTSVLNDWLLGWAQKPMTDLNIKAGGYVEGSYTYNFRAPKSGINEGRVFDFEHNAARLNQIALQLARNPDVAADAKAGKWDLGFGLDAMWGSDGRLIHANGLPVNNHITHPENQFDPTQAYLDIIVPIGTGLDIKVGKFVTLLGYETISPIATVTGSSGNALYSHSYNFGFAIPFTHTGVLATYSLSDKLKITAGFTRGWEQATNDNNSSLDVIGEAVYTVSEELALTFNGIVGPEKFHNNHDYRAVAEVIAAFTPKHSALTFALDGVGGWEAHSSFSGGSAYWYGVTGYVGYKLCDMCTVNGRLEWFRDDGGSRLGIDGNFYEGTIGLTIHPFKDKLGANFMIRPELRGDYSNKNAFGGGMHKTQATAAVDAIFAL
jgi:hypothetical protein